MRKTLWLHTGLLIIGLGVPLAGAAEHPQVIVSPGVTKAYLTGLRNGPVRIVTRAVHEPAAVVSRALAVQPVWPHLIELEVANSTVYLDPQSEDLKLQLHRLGRGHSFRKAYEKWASQHHPNGARVIAGKNYRRPDRAAALRIQPRMILQKPLVPGRKSAPHIPSVPAAPKDRESQHLIAMAQ